LKVGALVIPSPLRREDVLVSLCFSDAPSSDHDVALIVKAAKLICSRFRYWEILVVVSVNTSSGRYLERCLKEVQNIRVLKVRASSRYFPTRVVAASEAIGDVVILTSFPEAPVVEYIALINIALEHDTVVICTREGRNVSSPFLNVLWAISGFRISSNYMHTTAFSRTALNQILAHPERDLALRFPPRGEGFPVHELAIKNFHQIANESHKFRRRMGLAYRLTVNSAPMVLFGVATLSVGVVLVSMLYAIYAVLIWLFAKNVQPGWFTTSLMLSLTATCLGAALLGISMGIQRALEWLAPNPEDTIVDEAVNTNLFVESNDLNVDVETAPATQRTVPPA
jgi:hypothetical protein